MFGASYFGRYFGGRYFGKKGTAVAVPAVVIRGGAGRLNLPFFKPAPDFVHAPPRLHVVRSFVSRVSLFLSVKSKFELLNPELRAFADTLLVRDVMQIDRLGRDLADINAVMGAELAEREYLWLRATERAVARFAPQLRTKIGPPCSDENEERFRQKAIGRLAADFVEYVQAEFQRMTARPVEKAPAEIPTDRELLARANTRERRRQRRMLN